MRHTNDAIRIIEGRWNAITDHLRAVSSDREPLSGRLRYERVELASVDGREYDLTANDGEIVIQER